MVDLCNSSKVRNTNSLASWHTELAEFTAQYKLYIHLLGETRLRHANISDYPTICFTGKIEPGMQEET